MICPRSAILHSAAASSVASIFEVDRFDRGENRDLRLLHAQRHREVDRVLADIDLVFERRCDVDRRIGDDEDLVIGRHVHDEHVTDAPSGPQARLSRDNCAEELVGVQAAFHQELGVALAHELDSLGCGRVAVRGIDDGRRTERDAGLLREVVDLGRGADENRGDESLRAGLDRAGERRLLAGMRDRRRRPAPGSGIAAAAIRTFRFRLMES